MEIRQEQPLDHPLVFKLIENTCCNHQDKNYHENHFLVDRIRTSSSFIPELSLVATREDEIIGYIMLSKLQIISKDQEFASLSLTSLVVNPKFQRLGIGSNLIERSHQIAKQIGYTSVILYTIINYNTRFGYKDLREFNIDFPKNIDANFLVKELVDGALNDVSGLITYPNEFF